MKSETLVKINENRKKYFLEIRKQQTEEKCRLNSPPEKKSSAKKRKNQFEEVIKIAKKGIPALYFRKALKKYKIFQVKTSRSINKTNTKIVEFVNRKTEKTRERIFSFLLVLFDA